jgi:hypothetical protein
MSYDSIIRRNLSPALTGGGSISDSTASHGYDAVTEASREQLQGLNRVSHFLFLFHNSNNGSGGPREHMKAVVEVKGLVSSAASITWHRVSR